MIFVVSVKANDGIMRSGRLEMKCSGVRSYQAVVYFMASLAMGGCALIKPAMPPLASVEGVQGHFRIGRIIHLDTGKALSFDRFIDQLESKDLIFIGENHDNPEHHLIQVQILQALLARSGDLSVAMEFFQEPQQPVLDRYMKGTSTEADFLRDVDWQKTWSFDYYLYRPLIFMLREKQSKIHAINAPNDIVKKVARSGLDSLKPEERDQLAKDIDLDNEKHRAYLRDVYKQHSSKDLKKFDYFYQAQCVWEDTMAENIGEYLKENKQRVIVFTGNGHIIKRYGTPDRTLKRVKVNMATVVLYPLNDRETIKKETADYVWLTGDCSRRHFMGRHKHASSQP
jgi:uncharacterized iron-regulated protein